MIDTVPRQALVSGKSYALDIEGCWGMAALFSRGRLKRERDQKTIGLTCTADAALSSSCSGGCSIGCSGGCGSGGGGSGSALHAHATLKPLAFCQDGECNDRAATAAQCKGVRFNQISVIFKNI